MTELTTQPLDTAAFDALVDVAMPEEPAAGGRVDVSRVSVLGWVVSALVLIQTLIWLPDATSILPEKMAVLVVLGGLGLPYLVATALGRAAGRTSSTLRWGARLGAVFLVWAALSAALSATPEASFFGLYSDLTGWFFFLLLFGAWAISTRLSNTQDQKVLELAIIAGATGNAVVALIQQHANLSGIGLPLYNGTLQPTGMVGNPVFLGALLAAALTLVAPRFARAPLLWAPVVAALGLGLGVGGERLPALIAVVVVIGEILGSAYGAWRSSIPGVRAIVRAAAPMAAFAALAIGALLIGSVTAGTNTVGLPSTPSTISGGAGAKAASPSTGAGPTIVAHGGVISHISSSTSTETFNERFDLWRASWDAFVQRPLQGYGPDQFRTGTLPHYDPSLILDITTDVYQDAVFTDAHNIVIELGVTVGIVGLGLFAGWLFFALRRRRGPLVVFALVLLVSQLAEPLNIVITALMVVALGAALQRGPTGEPGASDEDVSISIGNRRLPERRMLAGISWALGALALIPALLFIFGDIAYESAITAPPLAPGTSSNASTSETLLSPWPQPATEWANIESTGYLDAMPQAVGWEQAALARDRTNPVTLEVLASMEAYVGNLQAAHAAAAAAVANQPWLVPALDLLGVIDWNQAHQAEGRHLFEESLARIPNQPLISYYLSGRCIPLLPGTLTTRGLTIGCGNPASG